MCPCRFSNTILSSTARAVASTLTTSSVATRYIKARERQRLNIDALALAPPQDMMDKKPITVDMASTELERRSRYLSTLIQCTKLSAEGDQKGELEVMKKSKETDVDAGGGGISGDSKEGELKNVRVRVADMPAALQPQAFRCASDVLAGMPKLDS